MYAYAEENDTELLKIDYKSTEALFEEQNEELQK